MQFAWGFAPPLILEVAIRNRVFDFLDAAEHSVEEVAELTNGSIRGWRAILNCLVGLDFLTKKNGRYQTTPESSTYLVTTKPTLVFAVNMLVNSAEGDTYPFKQVAGWLEEAGFVDARDLPAPGTAPLILASRALT